MDVPLAELEEVEGGYKMRRAAAQACRKLLVAARTAQQTAAKGGDAAASKVSNIGVVSAYRDFAYDTRAWNSAFDTQYDTSLSARQKAHGGEHGAAAARAMLALMRKYKASPGFSNHTNGTAVDFTTTEGGNTLGAKTKQKPDWQQSWLHDWLKKNAKTYNFHPLKTEEWHWDYQAP